MLNTINIDKKIFYEKEFRFEIYPKMDEDMMDQLDKYLKKLNNAYPSIENNLFWKINHNQCIEVDESISTTSYDIYHQLLSILQWLFDRNYRVNGHFYYRIGNNIEYISVNSQNNLIKHFTLIDNTSINVLIGHNVNDNIQEYILEDSIKKIDMHIELDKINTSCLQLNPVENSCIESFSNRLYVAENKIKNISRKNKYYLRLLLAGGTITAIGSFVLFRKIYNK